MSVDNMEVVRDEVEDTTTQVAAEQEQEQPAAAIANGGSLQGELEYAERLQFPWKLHAILEHDDCKGIISWVDDHTVIVNDRKKLVETVMPRFLKTISSFQTFQRNLDLWKFRTFGDGSFMKVTFSHPQFVRGQPYLCSNMKVPILKDKRKQNPASRAAAAETKKKEREQRIREVQCRARMMATDHNFRVCSYVSVVVSRMSRVWLTSVSLVVYCCRLPTL